MRKKWTPQEDETQTNFQSKEKKKWQIALRRYVLEKNPSRYYAPFFGLDIESFRNWIAAQFNEELHWDNFGKEWQFEHIIPASYFTNEEQDMKLCWNFTNIIVSSTHLFHNPDIISSRIYFQKLWEHSGYDRCRLMLEKISRIESEKGFHAQISFFEGKKEDINSMSTCTEDDFERLNKGETISNLILEKQILSKFGG